MKLLTICLDEELHPILIGASPVTLRKVEKLAQLGTNQDPWQTAVSKPPPKSPVFTKSPGNVWEK